MVGMTVTSPRERHGAFSRADLDALRPEHGGERFELLDGAIVVTPAPGRWHQAVSLELGILLRTHRPEGMVVKLAPFAVVLGDDTEVQPDIVVARRDDLTDTDLPAAPLLVVEILSPSTRNYDLLLKRERYAKAGVPSYWVVDPDVPSIAVLELDEATGDYRQSHAAAGDEAIRVDAPFEVELSPARLLQE